MFIAFLGCDGSGKSAVIAGVTDRLKARGVTVTRGHWRPTMNAMGGGGGAAADDPHGQMPRGWIGSVLKLKWLWLSWWVGWFRSLRSRAREGVLLFDRYHADLLVDPVRYRYGGPQWIARLASRWMPQPDIVFYLDAPPEVLFSRKQEVPKEALERSRAAYLELAASHPRFRIVDASRPLMEVIDETIKAIRAD